MAQNIGVQGLPLPGPISLYPVQTGVPSIPNLAATNAVSLAPGQSILIPSGKFMTVLGLYTTIQVQDPVSQTWLFLENAAAGDANIIESDGQNYRIINPTGFPVAAVVTNSGSGYTSAPAVASTIGGATWTVIMGPTLSALTCPSTITKASGAGYSLPPIINIAAPPSPGVQATAVCSISGGTISTFTIINPGANYLSPPSVVVTPNPFDPNFGPTSTTATTNATVVAQTSYAGQVADVLLANPGTNFVVPPSGAPVQVGLTFSGGGGNSAAATPIVPQTVTAITMTSAGSFFTGAIGISTVGGSLFTQTSGILAGTASPIVSSSFLVPRQAQISATQGSATGVQPGIIIDGGMFTAAPVPYAVAGSGFIATAQMGGSNDTVYITPL